jgi:hypothetical protein
MAFAKQRMQNWLEKSQKDFAIFAYNPVLPPILMPKQENHTGNHLSLGQQLYFKYLLLIMANKRKELKG